MNSKKVAEQIAKMVGAFEALVKSDPDIREAIRHLRGKAKEGLVDRHHVDTVSRAIFVDRLTGGIMGNQAAYEDFEKGVEQGSNPGGIHIRMDANDFKSYNDAYGYDEGTEAIKSIGQNIRDVVDQHIGQSRSKLFRLGGDEFHLWVPDYESAARFTRAMRSRMQSLVPFHGTHNWSLCYGFASRPKEVDEALKIAKKAKTAAKHPVGQAEHYAHSLVQGHEGAIPVSQPLTRFNIT